VWTEAARVNIIDANGLGRDVTVEADVCVIGSGAAGMTVATQLDGHAERVCLVESGSFAPDEATQELYAIDSVGHPVRENFMSRARYFGGTCNLWAGRSMKLTPLDLAQRPWIPHSGWPITYDELARFYPPAERILRLPGQRAVDRVVSRTRQHPVEALLCSNDELHPNVSLWATRPRRFGSAYKRQLSASRNVVTYLNANVTAIELNAGGTCVEACTGSTLGGVRLRFRARRFVLACGGLETARLLLASRSVQPNGIGNDHDLVGRFYMDHPRAVFGHVHLTTPQKLPGLTGAALSEGMAQVGIRLREDVQEREQLLNNYLTLERHWSEQSARAYQSFVHSAKILLRAGYAGRRFSLSGARLAKVPELIYLLAPRELMPHPLYRMARQLKDRFTAGLTDLVIVNYCEQPPNSESRVYLTSERDRLGMPRLALNWVVGEQETRTLLRLQALLDASLRRHGIGYLTHGSSQFGELRYTDASHHLGTTRMSSQPDEGVVDVNCRVHGVANLFVAGSGVFPTSGHANPTLTIVALAVRLAEHLKTLR
jgi:choline dehydrogenase-like flavoprotein